MTELEQKYLQELSWGSPIEYKGVTLHPFTVADIFLFETISQCLLIDPLDYPNEKYQSMSRLKFLMSVSETMNLETLSEAEQPYRFLSQYFSMLLHMVFKNQRLYTDDPDNPSRTGKVIRVVRLFDIPSGKSGSSQLVITPQEFEVIRKLILYQNGVDFSDEDVPISMRKRYIQDMQRFDKDKRFTLSNEHYLDLLCTNMGTKRHQLRDMTLREFHMRTSELYSRDIYLAQLQGEMSGFVSFQKKPKHWLYIETKKEIIMNHFKTTDDIKGLMIE